MAGLKLVGVKKIYKNGTEAVKGFSMDIADNEFVVLVGPSGCGKTTLLRMIAGLEDITEGEVYIGDRLVNNVRSKDRDIAMVFQSHSLYPHFTVYENLAMPLKIRKEKREVIADKVQAVAKMLGVDHLLDRKPGMISGGEGQRVAIGRALIRNPAVFLMDEPLSNLDAKLRTQMRAEIMRLHEEIRTTFIYVTHDQVEAMSLGDRMVVMNAGVTQQTGTPEEIYERPSNAFVGSFIGSPQMNMIPGRIIRREDKWYQKLGGGLFLMNGDPSEYKDEVNGAEKKVFIGIRPGDLVIGGGDVTLDCRYKYAESLGDETNVHFSFMDNAITAKMSSKEVANRIASLKRGDEVTLGFDTLAAHYFDTETEKRLNVETL